MKKIVLMLIITVLMCNVAYAAMPEGHWFSEFKDPAASLNIFSIKDETFSPDDLITYDAFARIATVALGRVIAYNGEYAELPIPRGEALKIIIERLDYTDDMVTDDMRTKAETEIADFHSINNSEKNAVIIAYSKGIIIGDPDGCVNTNNNTTYAETLIMFMRLMNK